MIFQHHMIDINNLILNVAADGCNIEKEVIENIQYVNELLETSTITHQKEKNKVEDFEKILVTPTIVYVNGVDFLIWNDQQKLTEIRVFIRPFEALNAIKEFMVKYL